MSEVLRALREAGIKDLEDLVGRVLGKFQAESEALDLFAPVSEPPAGASLSHRPPKIPFTIAGVTYDPRDISRFDGQPLHFMCRRVGDHDTQLIGFVGNEWVRAITAYFQLRQLGQLTAATAGSAAFRRWTNAYYIPGQLYQDPDPGLFKGGGGVVPGPPGHEVPTLAGRFYYNANFQGEMLLVEGNRAYSDLTKVGRGFANLDDWNDVISSVGTDGATLLLFEHIHYAGDSLVVLPSDYLNNLDNVGWNDRISSIKNFGQVY